MRIICLTFFILLYVSSIFSQYYHIKGKVSSKNPSDAIIGNAYLMDNENAMVKLAAIENGEFTIDEILNGEYTLIVSCFGFERKDEKITVNENKTITVYFDNKNIDLEEVAIIANKQVFSNRNGNIKINVDNSFFSSLSDPINLLEKIPGIQVSFDQESINIIGKGNPLIYMGNKKITIDDLKSLSIEDIESIELINNPSSKYEADGRAVILITRKTKNQNGYKIILSEKAAMKHYFNNNFGVNFSLLRNKFELRTNIEYNQLKVWEKNGFQFNIHDKNIQTDYMTKAATTRPQIKLGIGAYYQINDNNYISVDMNGRPLYETYLITTDTYINHQEQEDSIYTRNNNKDNGIYYSGNINYETKFPDINAKLFLGGQYSLFDRRVKSDIYDTYQSVSQTFHSNRKQKSKVNAYSFKADYEQKFKNNMTWEIGTKFSFSDALTKMNNTSEDVAEANEASDYNYKENIYALYTSLTGKISYFSYSGGIRAENTDIRRNFGKLNDNYTRLFPKLSFGMELDSAKSLSLNYSKSIIRPNFKSSSQVEVYINPYYAISGNINLKPNITDELSFGMQINRVYWGISYYQTQDPIYSSTKYYEDRELLSLVSSNFQEEEGFNLSLNIPITYKSFSSNNTLIGIFNKVKDASAVYMTTKPYLYYYSHNQFVFPKDYVLTLLAWGFTKRKEGIFEKNAFFVADVSLSKTFFKKLNCTLMFSDIFNTMKFQEKFTINDIESKRFIYSDFRAISLSIKYTFGKEKESRYKNEIIDENLYRIK